MLIALHEGRRTCRLENEKEVMLDYRGVWLIITPRYCRCMTQVEHPLPETEDKTMNRKK